MRRAVLLACLALALASPVEGNPLPCRGSDPEDGRPRVGLALSGGGARGIAHVGVLRILEEMRIPVDCIAGTSMGAVVGGLYAAGLPLDELERLASEVDWDDALTDRPAFRDLPFRRKEDQHRYRTDIVLGLDKKGVALPGGLWSGQKLEVLLQGHTLPVAHIEDFSRLPIPFHAVATDLETGQPVVLTHGKLPEAIRASMAIPGVFTPVELDDRVLVDGGISNNLPVNVARDLGADVVIAVDISEPLLTRENLNSPLLVLSQTLSFLTQGNMEAQRRAADILLQPDLEGFGFLDFDTPKGLIERGAQTPADRLRRLAVDEIAFLEHHQRRGRPASLEEPLAFVEIRGQERVDERILLRHLKSVPGAPLELAVVKRDVARLVAMGDFENVAFTLERDAQGRPGLVFIVREQPWTTSLQASLEILLDQTGETALTAVLNATSRQLNPLGAELRFDLRLGQRLGAFGELYQPLSSSGFVFVAPRFEISSEQQNLFEDDQKISEIDFDTLTWGVDLGVHLGRSAELRMGFFGGRVESRVETGQPALPETTLDLGGLLARLTVDTLDQPDFPRRGFRLDSSLLLSRENLGADLSYDRFEGSASGYFGLGRHTVALTLAGGGPLGTILPVQDEFRLGGPLRLGALGEDQLRGQRYAYGRLAWYRHLMDLTAPLGAGVYAGLMIEAGNVWQAPGTSDLDDLLTGITLFAGAETFLGPVLLGLSRSEEGAQRLVLTLGRSL